MSVVPRHVLGVGLVSVGAICAGPLWAQDSAALDSIHRFVLFERTRQRIPGLSVTILRGDRVVLARGYGKANVELGVPASDSTIYQSGSVGKQFTAAAVVMLAEQGRFALDDRITRWLKEGVGVWDGITIRHLLTHTSGMAEYTDSTFDYPGQDPRHCGTLEPLWNIFDLTPEGRPSHWHEQLDYHA